MGWLIVLIVWTVLVGLIVAFMHSATSRKWKDKQ